MTFFIFFVERVFFSYFLPKITHLIQSRIVAYCRSVLVLDFNQTIWSKGAAEKEDYIQPEFDKFIMIFMVVSVIVVLLVVVMWCVAICFKVILVKEFLECFMKYSKTLKMADFGTDESTATCESGA